MDRNESSAKLKPDIKLVPGGNQMSLIRDTEEVIKFLEFTARKNILNEHAVNCRLTACHNLFSVVNEEEDSIDSLLKNLDVLVHRFRNKSKTTNDSTLKVYKSRVKSSLEDYLAWSTDPFAWERALTQKTKINAAESRKRQKAPKEVQKVAKTKATATPTESKATPAEVLPQAPATKAGSHRVVLPIREDFSIEITLPENGLTLKEFQRIGMFLYPYCKDIEFADFSWGKLPH